MLLAPLPDAPGGVDSVRARRIGAAVALATAGVGVFVAAEFDAAGGGSLRGAGLAASYLSGMTMLVLPCTLPMVFVMVPLVLARSLRQGIGMALAFSAGVTATLTAYGAIVAWMGSSLGITTATQAMWLVGGVAAYGFGLSQLGVLRMQLPSWRRPLPRWAWQRPGAFQAFGLGLLLGNAGLGCPCPSWYLLLSGVASSGSPAYGADMGLAQGLGRMTPILAVAIAAMLGVDATRLLLRRRAAVERATGALLMVLGAGIVVFMALAHNWWEATIIHAGWNHALAAIGGPAISEVSAGGGPLPPGLWWAPWLFVSLVVAPLLMMWRRSAQVRRNAEELSS